MSERRRIQGGQLWLQEHGQGGGWSGRLLCVQPDVGNPGQVIRIPLGPDDLAWLRVELGFALARLVADMQDMEDVRATVRKANGDGP